MHVAARSLAAQGLSIFGDHSDVMAVRQTGFALLASASVQEAHDLALVAQAATLATRVPFVHFFDGFRTSHELNTIEMLSDDDLRALVPEELVRAHRGRALSPGAAVHPRHRAEPRRLLPGARDGEPVLRPHPGRRRGRDGPPRRAHRPPLRHRRVRRASRRRAGAGRDGLRRGDRPGDRGCAQRAGRAGRRGRRCGCTGRSRPGRCSTRCPRACAGSPCSTGPRSPARSASRCSSTWSPRSTEAHADGERAVMPQGDRRPLRAVVEGVHARAWSPGCSRSWRASGRGAGSPSASTTTSPGRACPTTRRWTSSRPTPSARSSSGSARTERSARTRTRSRSSGPTSTCTPRATSSTTRRSRARRPCRTCASARSRSGRRTSCSRRASSAATSSGCSSRSTCSAGRRPARRCCSTAAHPPDEVWDALPRPGPGADPRQAHRRLRDRRRPDRPRGRPRRADQHRAADLLLRHLRRAAARRGDRPDQGGDREDLRPARRRGGRTQPGRGRPGAGGAAPDRGARAG